MKMTLGQALESIARGETPEQYFKRMQRIRRLVNEREALEDAISVLDGDERADKKRKRLETVKAEIERLS